MPDFQEVHKAMAPLLRNIWKTDGSISSAVDFEPLTAKFRAMSNLPAEQLKEKICSSLSGDRLQSLLDGLNPDNLTQEQLRAYADKYGCTDEELVVAFRALHEMTTDMMSDYAQRMNETSSEEIKAKLDAMAGKAEKLQGGSSE